MSNENKKTNMKLANPFEVSESEFQRFTDAIKQVLQEQKDLAEDSFIDDQAQEHDERYFDVDFLAEWLSTWFSKAAIKEGLDLILNPEDSVEDDNN